MGYNKNVPMRRHVNCDFFKNWKPEMAYVLGFFAADGNLTKGKRGNHYIEFTSCDRKLLEKIKKTVDSGHKISKKKPVKNRKDSYRLQIGNKEVFNDLVKLGVTPRKSLTLKMPPVPTKYLADFLRGYFDGDGNVWYGTAHKERKTKTPVLLTRFTSGSEIFLAELASALKFQLEVNGTITYSSRAYRLGYSTIPSLSLYKFMYNESHLFLPRKKKVFEKYINAVVA